MTTGRVAVQRGPLVYCLEELDQPEGTSLTNVALELGNSPSDKFQSQLQADLLGGVVVLHHSGRPTKGTRARMRYTPATLEGRRKAGGFH